MISFPVHDRQPFDTRKRTHGVLSKGTDLDLCFENVGGDYGVHHPFLRHLRQQLGRQRR